MSACSVVPGWVSALTMISNIAVSSTMRGSFGVKPVKAYSLYSLVSVVSLAVCISTALPWSGCGMPKLRMPTPSVRPGPSALARTCTV